MKNLLLSARHLVLAACLLLAAPALWSCNSETTAQKAVREHTELLKGIDEDTIQHYLRRNNLVSTATRTNSGLYLVSITNGTGTAITSGKQVRAKYVGRFLSNGANPGVSNYPGSIGDSRYPAGSIFDNSADNHSSCACVVFTAGGGNIPGFNEALLLMRQGDRKLLLIPSRLAYGPSAPPGSGIPNDSALMFDVEIIDVN